MCLAGRLLGPQCGSHRQPCAALSETAALYLSAMLHGSKHQLGYLRLIGSRRRATMASFGGVQKRGQAVKRTYNRLPRLLRTPFALANARHFELS
jgi:hypothetical protein